ncbi:hypothetical protein HanIR_Chr12g0613931 [Helianthus annuus]|nr:hypothetical protein HanIR_Chr12g0613931 [Helianthus annuus]
MIMVCRKWDVTSVNGRYMSTDYIVTDIKMGMVVSPLVLPHLHRSPLKTRGATHTDTS